MNIISQQDNNKRLVVIDSSVAVKWLNRKEEKLLLQADKILKDVEDEKIYIFMPELAKYEVGNALLNKGPELPLINLALEKFYDIPIQFIIEDFEFAKSTIEIAQNFKITYYDASFISLAEKLNADLVTDNPKHQKQKINGLKVISLKNYRG